ncbi:hypothetical protein OVA11_13530 [Caulobacter sp. SL161]|uniref:surface-adhesin E family protein n=1 Tax=Caulobacter sp. SL161 TaxID=2995156 RepID=UPI0022732D00|nr:surface-adhesin E family protein [Caulobacter sp. SL161]MCY1648045.1 hypothetical protein [Caulobacter sp. SL161]
MIGMLTAILLLAGQAGTPAPAVKDDTAKVDAVTITAAEKKPAAMPPWSRRIEGIGWPFMGVGEDKSVMMFAKTGKTPSGADYQRVWVRHEFRLPQTEAGLTFRSERLAQDVDCKTRAFRSLAVYRYPENNLGGEPVAFKFDENDWTRPDAGAFAETVVDAACMRPDAAA